MSNFATTAAPPAPTSRCASGERWDDIDRICVPLSTKPSSSSTLSKLKSQFSVRLVQSPTVLVSDPKVVPLPEPDQVVRDPRLAPPAPPPEPPPPLEPPPPSFDPKVAPLPEPEEADTDPKLPPLPPPPAPTPPPVFVSSGGGGGAPFPGGGALTPTLEIIPTIELVTPAPVSKKGSNTLLLLGGAALVAYLVLKK